MGYLTEQEKVNHLEYLTIEIEQKLKQQQTPATYLDEFPYPISLHAPTTFQHTYENKKHVELSGYCLEKMNEDWESYMKIVHPQTIASIYSFLPSFYRNSNKNKTISFVQYAILPGGDEFEPVIAFTKPSTLSDGTHLWLTMPPLSQMDNLSSIHRIIAIDQFKLKHFKQFQTLSDRELDILTLLANGHNNPAIAERLFISRQTVETHRKNIKRKLDINSYRDLMRYAFAFNLVEV
jgi:DNA-binding CsgD family transcriptional regulator